MSQIGARIRLLLVLAVVLTVCLSSVTIASAVVEFANPHPAEGTAATSPLDIRIKAADSNAELKVPLCSLMVKDASTGSTIVGLPALSIVDGVLKIEGAELTPGNYVALANSVDAKLKTRSMLWSFTVVNGALEDSIEFYNGYPTGAIVTKSPEVGISYVGGTSLISARINIDSKAYSYPGDLIVADSKLAIPAGLLNLAPGEYTAQASVVLDGSGEQFSDSWVFIVPAESSDLINCFASGCHESIMERHAFVECGPCHGSGSPFGGGYSYKDLSPHSYQVSCVDVGCHDGVTSVYNQSALLATCGECHDSSVHHDYALQDEACVRCHDQGSPDGKLPCYGACHAEFDHHIKAEEPPENCLKCHDQYGPDGTFVCGDCHENADHHSDAKAPEQKCIDCHEIGSLDGERECSLCHGVFDHHILAEEPEAFCLQCHDEYSTEGTISCQDCHDVIDHHKNAMSAEEKCLDCHDQAAPEGTIDCADCHAGYDHHVTAGTTLTANVPCVRCHKTLGKPDAENLCSRCHLSSETSRDAHHSKAENVENVSVYDHKNGWCLSCHDSYGYASLQIPDWNGYQFAENVDPDALACRDCHVDGAIGSSAHLNGGMGIDAECADCHTPYSGLDASCIECHLESPQFNVSQVHHRRAYSDAEGCNQGTCHNGIGSEKGIVVCESCHTPH
ncbi:MAG: hypothetical protein FWE87_04170 [Coriobacteriia bacterium]|nr:hypothetical protein [Coriobacteriia bacterium]